MTPEQGNRLSQETERAGGLIAAVVLLAAALYVHGRGNGGAALLAVSGAVIATLVSLGIGWPFPRVVRVGPRALMALICVELLLFVSGTFQTMRRVGLGPEGRTVVAVLTVAMVVSAFSSLASVRPWARWAAVLLVGLHFGVSAMMTQGTVDFIVDVREFQRLGADALLAGDNPYSVRFPDIYPPELSEVFYGPGISVDGVLTRGYPYPPASLLPIVPVAPILDVRWAHRLAVAATAATILAVGRNNPRSRLATVVFLLAPGSIGLAVGGWTEVFLGMALSIAVLAYQHRSRLAPLALGFFFALKQYTVLFIPLIPLLARGEPMKVFARRLAVGLSPWLALTIGFAMWDLQSFFDAVVSWQFVQPFRPDSLSLLVSAVNEFGWPPESWYPVVPLITGLGSAGLLAWKSARTTRAWALGVGVVMLWFVLFSKQAFLNYYYLAIVAIAISLAAPEPDRDCTSATHRKHTGD